MSQTKQNNEKMRIIDDVIDHKPVKTYSLFLREEFCIIQILTKSTVTKAENYLSANNAEHRKVNLMSRVLFAKEMSLYWPFFVQFDNYSTFRVCMSVLIYFQSRWEALSFLIFFYVNKLLNAKRKRQYHYNLLFFPIMEAVTKTLLWLWHPGASINL